MWAGSLLLIFFLCVSSKGGGWLVTLPPPWIRLCNTFCSFGFIKGCSIHFVYLITELFRWGIQPNRTNAQKHCVPCSKLLTTHSSFRSWYTPQCTGTTFFSIFWISCNIKRWFVHLFKNILYLWKWVQNVKLVNFINIQICLYDCYEVDTDEYKLNWIRICGNCKYVHKLLYEPGINTFY